MHKIEKGIQIENFIRNYLRDNTAIDRLNQNFHDEFTRQFGGKQVFYYLGACPNLLAMKWIKKLYDQGILKRGIIGLRDMESGFPKWVYSYTLSDWANK